MNGIIIGQYLPGQSFWHRLDPRSKIIATSLNEDPVGAKMTGSSFKDYCNIFICDFKFFN